MAFTIELSHGAAPIPDFSGKWAYPYWPSFELPLSGPGPVVNKMRRRQLLDADGQPLPAANAPLAGDPLRLVGDYTNPILKPEAAEVVRKQGELELNGGAPTPTNQCWPSPVPYIFRAIGMEMFQKPDRITIRYYSDQVRRVRINQSHPARVAPSWYGDSVGHYEGDTLVIDTVGIKVDRPVAMVDITVPRTPRLFMWWNVTGSSIMKLPGKRKNATGRRIGGSTQPLLKGGCPTPAIRAKGCSSVYDRG